MRLVIDKGELYRAEVDLSEAQERMLDGSLSAEERASAAREATISYRKVLEVVCRCVRVVPS